MDEKNIIPYIEPIFRFCCKRLSSRYDAEDLASEIMCHILEGMKKYRIESLDAWVWRIAHNRYAKYIDSKSKTNMILTEDTVLFDIADINHNSFDEESTQHQFETVFRYLHTLSSEYRNIFIDYYIGEMPIRMLSKKYSLPETTIKWRLNVGRQKIRKRIGEKSMEKVYKRINWNTTCCNGSMDSDKYLHNQISRAICQAVYEKPLTVEEISISTGIPAMYIEDELSRLEYGDAVCKIGNKYATDFIVFRLKDRKDAEAVSLPLVKELSDKFENLFSNQVDKMSELEFYGHEFGLERLGHMIVPYILRRKIGELKSEGLKFENGQFPPRKDGGYGWFIVEETVDDNEQLSEYNTGCNVAGDDSGSRNATLSHIYYYWVSKYFEHEIYHDGGTRWLCANGIPQKCIDGVIDKEVITDERLARLIQKNLVAKSGNYYKINFPCFTENQFYEFMSLFEIKDENLDNMLIEWIVTVRKNFVRFVPVRLHEQINQWVSLYLFQIIGYVIDELINRGVLIKPGRDKPLVDGVFYVEGKYINP